MGIVVASCFSGFRDSGKAVRLLPGLREPRGSETRCDAFLSRQWQAVPALNSVARESQCSRASTSGQRCGRLPGHTGDISLDGLSVTHQGPGRPGSVEYAGDPGTKRTRTL